METWFRYVVSSDWPVHAEGIEGGGFRVEVAFRGCGGYSVL